MFFFQTQMECELGDISASGPARITHNSSFCSSFKIKGTLWSAWKQDFHFFCPKIGPTSATCASKFALSKQDFFESANFPLFGPENCYLLGMPYIIRKPLKFSIFWCTETPEINFFWHRQHWKTHFWKMRFLAVERGICLQGTKRTSDSDAAWNSASDSVPNSKCNFGTVFNSQMQVGLYKTCLSLRQFWCQKFSFKNSWKVNKTSLVELDESFPMV